MDRRRLIPIMAAASLVGALMVAPAVSANGGNTLPEGTHDGSTLSVAYGEYCYANGWASDPDHLGVPLVVRILADGVEVWSGPGSNDPRHDAPGGNGFWVNLVELIAPDVQHVISVQAQDADTAEWVPLNQTPRTLTCLSGNTLPTGTHEAVQGATNSDCVAAGWAADPDNWAHVLVRISSDGEPIAWVVADEFRQDLLDAEIGDGTHGFRVNIGPLISSDVPHVIRVEAQDANSLQWADIDWTPLTITCTQIFGTHEGFQGVASKAECQATGWAADLDTPTGPRVQVRAKVDGRVVAEATASEFREDVLAAGFGDGYSGFTINLFGKVTPNRAHEVTVEARDTTAKRIWVPLDWTPLQLTCSPL